MSHPGQKYMSKHKSKASREMCLRVRWSKERKKGEKDRDRSCKVCGNRQRHYEMVNRVLTLYLNSYETMGRKTDVNLKETTCVGGLFMQL